MKKIVFLSTLFFINSIYAQTPIAKNNPIVAKKIAGVYKYRGVEGTGDAHIFLENGDYCYIAGAVGSVINFAGKWKTTLQKDGSQKITLERRSYFNTLFPAWLSTSETTSQPQIIITERYFQNSAILGFSDTDKPKELKSLFKNRASQGNSYRSINIPETARYVFVGVDKNKQGKFLYNRYDLTEAKKTLHPLYIGVDTNYAVVQNLENSPTDMRFMKDSLIIKDEDNYSYSYKRRTFKPTSEIPNKTEQQYYSGMCVKPIFEQKKELAMMSLIFLPEYIEKPSQLLKPTIIAWQGDFSKDAWFDKPDPNAKPNRTP